MSAHSIGDLANTFRMRRLSVGLKTDLTRFGQELATGVKSDLGATLAGDFGPLAAIERNLKSLAAYKTANAEVASLFSAAQLAWENVHETGRELAPGLLTAANSRDPRLLSAVSGDARQKFDSVVSALNTRSADRALFSGAATDRVPLASADVMMAELVALTSTETTAAGISSAVDAWFDAPGGGFETLGYLGSTTDMAPFMLSEGDSASVEMRADNQVVRDTLKSFALAALASKGALSGDPTQQARLIEIASERVLTLDGKITDVRASIGAIEARIQDARARNAAEQSAYELARADLVEADPYETATNLEATYSQIETLYTVTARIAGLKFTDFMR